MLTTAVLVKSRWHSTAIGSRRRLAPPSSFAAIGRGGVYPPRIGSSVLARSAFVALLGCYVAPTFQSESRTTHDTINIHTVLRLRPPVWNGREPSLSPSPIRDVRVRVPSTPPVVAVHILSQPKPKLIAAPI
ncbi:hypothetical protein B0H17DRAFT_1197447 [Mycena rosella]|uniref:Uncharacterized protein n=1 Tax=Mycena rosella TaxID=1033263 RepID=A0AAD7GNI1_MYCRO|nr:hypothetical protein B0H17DRAFT_1197447 [Mycena rosella]